MLIVNTIVDILYYVKAVASIWAEGAVNRHTHTHTQRVTFALMPIFEIR